MVAKVINTIKATNPRKDCYTNEYLKRREFYCSRCKENFSTIDDSFKVKCPWCWTEVERDSETKKAFERKPNINKVHNI